MSPIAPWLLFLRHHRVGLLLAAAVALALVCAAAQHSEYAFAGRGDATTPLVRAITLAIGAVVGVGVGGNPAEVEALAGRRRTLAVNALICALTIAATGILTLAITVGAWNADAPPPWGLIAMLVRSTIASAGLALLSATLFGHLYAWALPIAAMPAFTLLGSGIDGQPLWWNTMNAAADELPGWGIALLLYTGGVAAWNTHGWYWLVPWRRGR